MIERYAVLSVNQFIQPDGYILEFYTDRTCHLSLRYTTIVPVTHREPALRRGLLIHTNPRFCFVAYTEMEQQEAGDTITHSFYYKWDVLPAPFYFYLIGTINSVHSPSTSPMMHLPLEPYTPTETKYQHTGSHVYTSITWNKPYAFGFKCPTETKLAGFQLPIIGLNQIGKVTFRLYDTEPEFNRPNNILRSTTFPFIPDKRTSPNLGELYFPIMPIYLENNTYYAIELLGDPDKPDTPTIAWEWNNLDPVDPTEWEFRRREHNGDWMWDIFTHRYFGYRSWWNIPYFQPGVPTRVQIPA